MNHNNGFKWKWTLLIIMVSNENELYLQSWQPLDCRCRVSLYTSVTEEKSNLKKKSFEMKLIVFIKTSFFSLYRHDSAFHQCNTSEWNDYLVVELPNWLCDWASRAQAGHLLLAQKPLQLCRSVSLAGEVFSQDVVNEQRSGHGLMFKRNCQNLVGN